MNISSKIAKFAKSYFSPPPIRWDRWIWDNNNAEGIILESGLAVVLPGLVTARAFAMEFDHDLYQQARLYFNYPSTPRDPRRFHAVRLLIIAGISMDDASCIYRSCWKCQVQKRNGEEFNLSPICTTLSFIYARGKILWHERKELHSFFFGETSFYDRSITVPQLFDRIKCLSWTRS